MAEKKKMSTGAIVGIVFGAIALVGIGGWLLLKKDNDVDSGGGSGADDGTGSGSGSGGAGSAGSTGGGLLQTGVDIANQVLNTGTTPTAGSGKVYTASAVSEEEKNKRLVINLWSRPPKGDIVKNKYVRLSDFGKYDGRYKISYVWIDDSNNVGAIFLPTNKVTVNTVDNTAWSGKGKITYDV